MSLSPTFGTRANRKGLTRALVAAGATAALLTTACTDNAPADPSGDPAHVTVSASDNACTVSPTEAPSGRVTFTVTNDGSKINEFYLLASDGLRIIGEVENIGPGITRELVVTAQPGSYLTSCKPGMVGEGIRATFTVTGAESAVNGTQSTVNGEDRELVQQATARYEAYVREQTDQLLAKTELFAAAVNSRDDDTARKLYPDARTHWERIETVAESFGDLDPRMDAREADLAEGEEWTGWHRLEKDLWPQRATDHVALDYVALTPAERTRLTGQLVADTRDLHERTRTLAFTADQIGNGAKGLLDEVATGKVTGEEEYWSRTDLWDFQANVDGARVAWEGLRPLLQKKNPALDSQLETDFASLQTLLDRHRVGDSGAEGRASGDGFKSYDQLTPDEVRALSDAVNALSEPLSQLTAAVV